MSQQEDRRNNEERAEMVKRALKEAIKDWLDEKFATFGKWSLGAIAALALAALAYFILTTHGWKAPTT